MKSWSDTKGSMNQGSKRVSHFIDVFDLTEDFATVRFLGPVTAYAQHWVSIKTEKKGILNIPKTCRNYNPDTEEYDDNGCIWCREGFEATVKYVSNAIIRDVQEKGKPKNAPELQDKEKKTRDLGGYKCRIKAGKSSKSWTPIMAIEIGSGMHGKLKDLAATNKVKKGDETKIVGIEHPKYGIDVNVKYNKNKKGPDKNAAVKEERTVLDEKELRYLMQDLTLVQKVIPTEAEQKREWKQDKGKLVDRETGELLYGKGNDDDEEVSKKKRGKGKKGRDRDDDDDDDLDDDIEEHDVEDDDDEDDRKSKKKKKRSSDDDDDDDDEDDDEPKKKKKKKGKKSSDDDDDDEDDDDDRKSSKKSKKKSKSDDDDDDDDGDDWDDDDDDDDDRKSKKKKKNKKSKKDDDEDDDDDSDDDDDDE